MAYESKNQEFEGLKVIQSFSMSLQVQTDVLFDPNTGKRYAVLHEHKSRGEIGSPITVIRLDD